MNAMQKTHAAIDNTAREFEAGKQIHWRGSCWFLYFLLASTCQARIHFFFFLFLSFFLSFNFFFCNFPLNFFFLKKKNVRTKKKLHNFFFSQLDTWRIVSSEKKNNESLWIHTSTIYNLISYNCDKICENFFKIRLMYALRACLVG